MNRITHDMTAWGAGIAIGVAIGLSLNNIALGIGVGAEWAQLCLQQNRIRKILQAKKNSPAFVGFFCL